MERTVFSVGTIAGAVLAHFAAREILQLDAANAAVLQFAVDAPATKPARTASR